MKKFLALFALVSVALACNLMNRKGSNTNSSSSSGTSTTSDGEPVEKANPTAAQQAAIANGQTVTWEQQGITWTLPANWKKIDARNESASYGGNGAFLTVAVSIMPQMASLVDTSIKAMYQGAKTEQKVGKYDEVRWLELDGVRGVTFRQSVQERPDDIRRLEWQAYRTYAGSTQLITMILSTNSGDFAKHQDALYGV
ncbi:MAG TPA: hypothetical protein VIT19_08740, partial [Pyrinomonadaceae bacterium]